MNILIVDDEELLVKGLKKSLLQEGFNVYAAYNGREALEILDREPVEFVLLDVMLPEIDGMTLCRRIRHNMDIPVIMLTAKGDYVDRIMGLEQGADDYVTKPFHTMELIMRIKAVARRFGKDQKSRETIHLDNLIINLPGRSVYRDGKEVPLTAREFDILKLLAENKGRVFSRDRIFEMVWNEDICDTRTVDVHISKLREKLEADPSNPRSIITKWGVGYFVRKEGL